MRVLPTMNEKLVDAEEEWEGDSNGDDGSSTGLSPELILVISWHKHVKFWNLRTSRRRTTMTCRHFLEHVGVTATIDPKCLS